MRSLQMKLLVAFLSVAAVAVAVVGLLVGRAASGAFGDYLVGRETGDLGAMDRMMEEMMGAGAGRAMMERMLGPAERDYLSSVQTAVWVAGGLAGLIAVALALLLARQIASPARALTVAARLVAGGDYGQRVPVRSRDELGELAVAFNSMAQSLGHQEELRRRLVADIAHELRTPLAIIQANLEAILDGVRPLSTAAVADIHEETQLLARLVTDLRDLSLAEAGQLTLRREPTDLGALAHRSVTKFEARARDKGIRLGVEAADDLPKADVDPDRVAQVLGNLLDNALRHAPDGGLVTVSVEPSTVSHMVEVAVTDNGPGILAEHLPYIFDRFYRADPARSRKQGGSGIGLAVVRQLTEAHGGRVRVGSAAGRGAAFHLQFPLAALAAVRGPS